jgi:hypothetical protein
MIGKGKGEDMMSTGKLFEYIGSRKPILGCVPDGTAKNTLLETKASLITDPYDVDEIEKALLRFYNLWKANALPTISPEFAEKYNRINITNSLAKIFELLVDYSTFQKR